MGHFNSKLFRAVAYGPDGQESNRQNRKWTDIQRSKFEESKTAFYEIIMLRAARMLEVSSQDEIDDHNKRVTHVSLSITITSEAARRDMNGDGGLEHEAHPQVIFSEFATAEAGIDIETSVLDDSETLSAINKTKIIGLVCPD